MQQTVIRRRAAAMALMLGLAAAAAPVQADTPAQQRAEIQKMRSSTLERLYKVHPAARADVQKAAGYAVFSNVGINLILLSAAGGSGVAHDNRSGKDTYMKMVSGGIGIGLGVKDFRGGVRVCHHRKTQPVCRQRLGGQCSGRRCRQGW